MEFIYFLCAVSVFSSDAYNKDTYLLFYRSFSENHESFSFKIVCVRGESLLPVLKTYWNSHEGRTHWQEPAGQRYSVTSVGLSNSKMSIRAGVSECPFLSTFLCLGLVELHTNVEVVLYLSQMAEKDTLSFYSLIFYAALSIFTQSNLPFSLSLSDPIGFSC